MRSKNTLILIIRKIAKIKVNTNRDFLYKINEFKGEIRLKLDQVEDHGTKIKSILKNIKTFETDLKFHLDKYPTNEYAFDLLKGKY